ncbi:MAG: VCBS repeat-containing protein [Pirellulaceae bacterium]|nr:VCBS repeat-containing protein [Pirellulaceae bacterium]
MSRTFLALIVTLAVVGCSGSQPVPPAAPEATVASASPDDSQVMAVLADFNRGNALMEQYRYGDAVEAYEKVVQARPDWIAAQFNLGMAYLNLQGEREAKESLDVARQKFEHVLTLDANHAAALFSLGMYYQYMGETEQAVEYFQRAHRADPEDLHVAYKLAEVLLAVEQNDQGLKLLENVVARNPGFVSAIYRLAMQYRSTQQSDRVMPLLDRFRRLQAAELSGGSFAVQTSYGAAGKHYLILGADNLPLERRPDDTLRQPVFSPEVRQLGVETQAWDWGGGRIELPGIAVADIDGDGDLDLCLTAAGPEGETSLWINDAKGNFTSGQRLESRGVSPCFGDVDNDGDVDLWLGRAGADALLLNDGQGQFSPASAQNVAGADVLTQLARLVDLDSDGDLDLLAFRSARGSVPGNEDHQPAASSVFLSNRDQTFADRAETLGLEFDDSAVTGMLYDDLDNDYDMDLVLFLSDGTIKAWINDRVGAFRMVDGAEIGLEAKLVIAAASGDPYKRGNRDLLLFTASGMTLMRNDGYGRFSRDEGFTSAWGRLGGTGGQFVDIDNDGDLDLVLGDARRRDGTRGPVLLLNQWPKAQFVDAADVVPGLLLTAIETAGDASCVAADFTGNGRCDLLISASGRSPLLIENVTSGGQWIQLDLAGTRPADQMARSNRSGIGARVEVKTGDVFQQYFVGGASGPVAMPPLRVHAGLGDYTKLDWLRVIWPDAVLQAELELAANRVAAVEQLNRKTSSCPYLFAWTGSRFEFVADFGGVGGLGYLLEPGVYATPDQTEYLPLPELQPLDGHYVLQSVTPLEEVTYFDEAKLLAIDHPIGTRIYPNEMMAINAAPPAFEVFCFRRTIEPRAATDHRSVDVTEAVRQVDRQYAGATERDARFLGLAANHWVELDFGDRLAELAADDRPILVLYGWVEYGYSSSNYAAHQAGLRCQAPTIEVHRDGQWVNLFREVGYPAGVQHVMTLDMTGHLRPTDQRLRIRSNMDLYWDRVYLGLHDAASDLRITEVAPNSADLHFLGYPREYSPDGRHPNLCDYNNIDRTAAWKLMSGRYTRYGEVAELLTEADDCFVIMGHGEEITMRFDADALGPVPDGYRRSFLLKTHSYCKDMDLHTAHPDTVEPLPFQGMTGYPYGPNESYPDTAKTRQYREKFNTRQVLGPLN